MNSKKDDSKPDRERVYAVSTNRQRASHKLRNVEMSAAVNGECRLCKGVITPQEPGEGEADLVTREKVNASQSHD